MTSGVNSLVIVHRTFRIKRCMSHSIFSWCDASYAFELLEVVFKFAVKDRVVCSAFSTCCLVLTVVFLMSILPTVVAFGNLLLWNILLNIDDSWFDTDGCFFCEVIGFFQVVECQKNHAFFVSFSSIFWLLGQPFRLFCSSFFNNFL